MLRIKFLNDIACKISITIPNEPTGLPYSDALNIIKKFYPDKAVEILGKVEDAKTGGVFAKVNTNPPRYFDYHSEQSLQPLNSSTCRPPRFYLDLMDSFEADQVMRGYQYMLKSEKSRIDGL